MSTSTEHPITFFDISIGDKPIGRVVFSLYSDLVPKTAENFRKCCRLRTRDKLSELDIFQAHYAQARKGLDEQAKPSGIRDLRSIV